jgi:oxygen-independent coproporphyrinogen-3 oxidase
MVTTNNCWRKDFPAVDQEYVWIYPLVRDDKFNVQSLFSDPRGIVSDEASLYIHIPVCLFHCPMCRFYIELIHDRSEIEGYENYIIKELAFYKNSPAIQNMHLKSIYFGGGTASLLKPEALKKIIDSCLDVFERHEEVQITLESHPNVVDIAYLESVCEYGVNRISFGTQSFDDDDLRMLSLRQKAESNKKILKDARKAGVDTVAIDLIYRIPGQKDDTFYANIQCAVDLGVSSFSLYSLELQEQQKNIKGQQQTMDEDKRLFFESRDILLRNGFEHLAQPDFNMPGHTNQDVKVSWVAPQGQAIGLGAGAWSYFNDAVYCSNHNIKMYEEALDKGEFPILAGQHMNIEDEMSRYMVLGARGLRIPKLPFEEHFGISLEDVFFRELHFLEDKGLIRMTDKEVVLTDDGQYHVDNISKEFYSFANRCRLQPFSCGIASNMVKKA